MPFTPTASCVTMGGEEANAIADQATRPTFRQLARDQLPWLHSLARRMAGDCAEDVVQECLVKAYRSFDDLRDVQAAPAWFRQILLNCIRDRMRRQLVRPQEEPLDDVPAASLYQKIVEEDPWPYSDSVHVDFLHSFGQEDVWHVLDRIDPKYRVPLVLVHMEGMSTRAVARMFGVARGTVLSWLHRGRKQFEQQLWDYAVERDLLREEQRGARP
jgi:RNA polymerase sigma-70 factor (ECF subfamily)